VWDGLGRILGGIVAVVLAVLGAGALLGGFVLSLRRETEGFPTSSFASETTVLLGAGILCAGLALAEKGLLSNWAAHAATHQRGDRCLACPGSCARSVETKHCQPS